MNAQNKKTAVYLLGTFFCAALFVLPVWLYGVPRSNDLAQHYQFAASVEDSLKNSNPYPNWADKENEGYGGVGLRFYPPLGYYVLTFANILVKDWLTASCLSFLFWTTLSAFGFYFLAREFATAKSAFVGAVMYIFAPYHTTELYGSFMYAEFAAAAILPFCFLFLTRILHKNNHSDIFGFALSLTILIYTHLPISVIGSISFAVYVLFALGKKNFLSVAKRLSISLFSVVLAASFQLIKIISELKWINLSSDKYSAVDFYNYRDNFLFAFKYLGDLDSDIHSLWFLDLLLAVTLIFAVPFAVAAYRRNNNEITKKLKSVAALFIFTLFILTPLSIFVWDKLTILQKVQFPWRWLSIFSLMAVVFVSAGFDFAAEFAKTNKRPIFLMLCGVLFIGIAFSVAQVIKQALFIPPNEFKQLTENIISRPNNEEFLTIWTNKEAFKVKEQIRSSRKSRIIAWEPTRKVFGFDEGNAENVRIAQFYYPYWRAEINGANTEIKAADDGAILITIPNREAIVKLEFIEPASIKISTYISLLSWIFLISAYFLTRFKFDKNL